MSYFLKHISQQTNPLLALKAQAHGEVVRLSSMLVNAELHESWDQINIHEDMIRPGAATLIRKCQRCRLVARQSPCPKDKASCMTQLQKVSGMAASPCVGAPAHHWEAVAI